MKTNEFRSLNKKIAVAVLGVAVTFAMVAAVFSFVAEFSRSRNKTEIMINQLLDTVEYSAAIASYTSNQQIAQDVINGLLRNDIVHKVQLRGDQGLTLEKARATPGGHGFTIVRKLSSPFDSQQTIGTLTVDSEAYYSLEEAEHGALMNAINSILLIGLTTALILFVVRVRLAQPLARVSGALHAISAGEQNRLVPIPKNNDDELGRLIQDINRLLDVLETKFVNERALREQIEHIEKQLRTVFESTSAGLFELDAQGKLLTCNPTLTRVLNKPHLALEALVGQDFAEQFFEHAEHFQYMLRDALLSGQLETKDFLLSGAKGQEALWVHCLLSKIGGSESDARFEGVVFDISKRVADEQAIRYQAEYDALTGLLRRSAAEMQLKALLVVPMQIPVSVMLLDLDGFKAVNDLHGHDAGDQVLVEVARRLKASVRNQDVLARLGGDEFLVILKRCETINVERVIAEKIIDAVKQPIVLNSQVIVRIGVSIGIATYPEHGHDMASLLKAADEAMYGIKRNGKNGFAVKVV